MGNSTSSRTETVESTEGATSGVKFSSTAETTSVEETLASRVPETSSGSITTLPKVVSKRTQRKKRAKKYYGIRGAAQSRGTAGPDFYDNLTVEIHQALSNFDEQSPEQILDLCLIMDCTGSMSSWMAHCKDTLKDVIDDTVAKDPNCKVRVAFVGYRDFCDQDIFAIHDFSYTTDAVKTFMNSQRATGGGDTPEDVQGGLRRALDLSWSGDDDSVKLAFLCADAPGHGQQYHSESDNYPDGNPCGLQLEALLKEFSDREILLTCYKLTDTTETMYAMFPDAYNQGSEQDGIEFIDIRGQVKNAQRTGVSLHSREVRDCYAREFNTSKSVQISKMRSRKKGW